MAVQHTLQPKTFLLHSVPSLGMAVNADLDFPGIHPADYRCDSDNCQPLGSCRDRIRSMDRLHCNGLILPGCSHISSGILHRRDRRTSIPTSQQSPSWNQLHIFRAGALDNCGVRAVCWKNMPASLLIST